MRDQNSHFFASVVELESIKVHLDDIESEKEAIMQSVRDLIPEYPHSIVWSPQDWTLENAQSEPLLEALKHYYAEICQELRSLEAEQDDLADAKQNADVVLERTKAKLQLAQDDLKIAQRKKEKAGEIRKEARLAEQEVIQSFETSSDRVDCASARRPVDQNNDDHTGSPPPSSANNAHEDSSGPDHSDKNDDSHDATSGGE